MILGRPTAFWKVINTTLIPLLRGAGWLHSRHLDHTTPHRKVANTAGARVGERERERERERDGRERDGRERARARERERERETLIARLLKVRPSKVNLVNLSSRKRGFVASHADSSDLSRPTLEPACPTYCTGHVLYVL